MSGAAVGVAERPGAPLELRPDVPSSCQIAGSGSWGPAEIDRQPCAPSQAVCWAVLIAPGLDPRAHAGTSSVTAIALEAECRIRVSTVLSCSETSPSTAMSRPE